MRKLVEYPTPSLAERDRRWASTRKEMAARGLDCLVLCGWPAMWDFNIANARYLCPIGGNAEFNVLVFPAAGEPTSFIYSPVFTDYWRGAQSWVADVRPKRGTFAGLVSPVMIDYLVGLGITAVELLPIHASIDDRHLLERGLVNYWGYNTIGFFAPDPRFLIAFRDFER